MLGYGSGAGAGAGQVQGFQGFQGNALGLGLGGGAGARTGMQVRGGYYGMGNSLGGDAGGWAGGGGDGASWAYQVRCSTVFGAVCLERAALLHGCIRTGVARV